MDSNTIVTLIGSVGFPIVMCGALCVFISRTLKEMQTAITNNTNAIIKLTEKIDKEEKKK